MSVEIKTISKYISEIFWKEGYTLSTAESCTAGHIAATITSIPGSSHFYRGGVVAYANETKKRMLNVNVDTLEQFGAVSEETVIEMLHGVMEAIGTDYAVATSGIAGPGGGTHEKPVGTIWIAVGNREKVVTEKLSEDQGRDLNIQATTRKALQMLLDLVKLKEKDIE